MDREIVDKFKLTKQDYDRLLQVVDLIEDCQRKVVGFSSYTAIPLPSLGAYGVNMSDIKKLSEILENSTLIVKNRTAFLDEEYHKDDLVLRRLNPQLAREKILFLKNEANDAGLIILHFEDNVLKRDLGDRTLTCDFEPESYPIDLIEKLIKSKKPLKRSELGKENNWARTTEEINERTFKKLGLVKTKPLIINKGSGYEINSEVYKIK